MGGSLILLIGLFAVLSVVGMPLALGLSISSMITIYFTMTVPMTIIVEKLQLGADSFLMMAVPLFILAANIMNYAGVSDRIFKFARSLVGSLPGALGHANILASVIFAGISGSAVADSAALGKIEIKAMDDQGYPRQYSAAITCASATIGPIFPPSIPLVIYAGVASVSVGKLFIGGVLPGLLIAITLMIMNHFYSKKRNFPCDEKMGIIDIFRGFIASFLPIMTPVLIISGIVFGFCTPTEAAAFTVLYAFILGFFVYRELKVSLLPQIFLETIQSSGVILFIIAGASLFAWVLTVGQIGNVLTAFAASMGSPALFILAINIILIILGMFMETTAVLIVITPFLVPVAESMGIDLIYFGVMVVLNLMIGLSTPPFGLGLFTVSQVAELSIEEVVKGIMPFIPVLLIALILVILFPPIVTWLPSIMMK